VASQPRQASVPTGIGWWFDVASFPMPGVEKDHPTEERPSERADPVGRWAASHAPLLATVALFMSSSFGSYACPLSIQQRLPHSSARLALSQL